MESLFIKFLSFLETLRENALIVLSVLFLLSSGEELEFIERLNINVLEIGISGIFIGTNAHISSRDSIIFDIEQRFHLSNFTNLSENFYLVFMKYYDIAVPDSELDRPGVSIDHMFLIIDHLVQFHVLSFRNVQSQLIIISFIIISEVNGSLTSSGLRLGIRVMEENIHLEDTIFCIKIFPKVLCCKIQLIQRFIFNLTIIDKSLRLLYITIEIHNLPISGSILIGISRLPFPIRIHVINIINIINKIVSGFHMRTSDLDRIPFIGAIIIGTSIDTSSEVPFIHFEGFLIDIIAFSAQISHLPTVDSSLTDTALVEIG